MPAMQWSLARGFGEGGMIRKIKRMRYRDSAERVAKEIGVTVDLESWPDIWAFLEKHDSRYCGHDFLYVIADRANGLIKFGKSRRPSRRLRHLQTANGNVLQLWCYCPHVSPFTEKEIHKRLSKFRVTGEWFKLTPQVQDAINEVRNVIQRLPGSGKVL